MSSNAPPILMHPECARPENDLLDLSGVLALEALYEMATKQTAVRFGSVAVEKVLRVSMDDESARAIVSAVLSTGQSLLLSFDPKDEPTIKPHFQIIGPDETVR